jgi:TRAP-type C4-dicarboxylate transport system substrate-binding protein
LATEYQWHLASLEDENILKQIDPKLNEIVTLTDEERNLFKAKVKPVFEKFEKQIPQHIFSMFEESKLDLKS